MYRIVVFAVGLLSVNMLFARATEFVLQQGHSELVRVLVRSPDRRVFVSAGEDESIKVWDALSRRLLHTLNDHTDSVLAAGFSADGSRLASAGCDGLIHIRDTRNWRIERSFVKRELCTTAVDFSADNRWLAEATAGIVSIRSLTTAQPTTTIFVPGVRRLRFAPDSKLLVCNDEDGQILFYDVESLKLVRVIDGHERGVHTLAFSPSGALLASAGDGGRIKVWGKGGRLLHTLSGSFLQVSALSFSPDGLSLASGSQDGMVRTWDVRTGALKSSFRTGASVVTALTFLSDAGELVVANDKSILVLKGGSLVDKLGGAVSGAKAAKLAFGARGQRLAVGTWLGSVLVWDLQKGGLLRSKRVHKGRVTALAFAPSGDFLASAGRDDQVMLWRLGQKRRAVSSIKGHPGVSALSFGRRSDRLTIVKASGAMEVWNPYALRLLKKGTVKRESLKAGDWLAGVARERVQRVVFSRKRGLLAFTNSGDRRVRLWDVRLKKSAGNFRGSGGAVLDLAFSPDAKFLAAARVGDIVEIWNVRTGKLKWGIALLPAGEWLVYQPEKFFYASSSNGDSYAALRFDEELHAVFPLSLFRSKLRRGDLGKVGGRARPVIPLPKAALAKP